MEDLETYSREWQGEGRPSGEFPPDYPGWPDRGIALLGDFSGIQNFVFRPVPGAGGAARRLRSRSFRVSAYTELIARWCLRQIPIAQPRLLYSAGGRFLIASLPFPDCETKLCQMQTEIDTWAWRTFGGELAFHLAAAPFAAQTIPHEELRQALQKRRAQPLRMVLCSPEGWVTSNFLHAATASERKCDACATTRPVQANEEGKEICQDCMQDEELGKRLPQIAFARLSAQAGGYLSALGLEIELRHSLEPKKGDDWLALNQTAAGAEFWPLLRHVPQESDVTLDFDQIAEFAPGSRKWLGYLRIDVDNAGKSFISLGGNPLRTWALSRLLHLFFTWEAGGLLRHKFSDIYAVYGGGDDLFVIGPWTQTLDFALELRKKFGTGGGGLSFSAGLSLAKPREHILTQASLAAEELVAAKNDPGYGRNCGRDQIRALGVTADWETFAHLLQTAKQVTRWLESGDLPSRFLFRVLELHHAWGRAGRQHADRETALSVRYRPLLFYQICRNLKRGPASEWAHSLLRPPSGWPWVDFIIRYAMLAAKRGREEE